MSIVSRRVRYLRQGGSHCPGTAKVIMNRRESADGSRAKLITLFFFCHGGSEKLSTVWVRTIIPPVRVRWLRHDASRYYGLPKSPVRGSEFSRKAVIRLLVCLATSSAGLCSTHES